MCPSQKSTELREDIVSLIKFFQSLCAEKKYLKTFNIPELNSADNISQCIQLNPDQRTLSIDTNLNASRITPTGWINTVPLSNNVSTLPKRGYKAYKNKDNNTYLDIFFKDYIRKRNLVLSLLSIEIEFLISWYNPLNLSDLAINGEENVLKWFNQAITDRNLLEIVRTAWNISPSLAAFLPTRFKNNEIVQELTKLVQKYPMALCHVPEALDYLVTSDLILTDRLEV